MTREEEEALLRHLEENRLERRARSKGEENDSDVGPKSGPPSDSIRVPGRRPKTGRPPSTPDG
jgi:hypothetical protein